MTISVWLKFIFNRVENNVEKGENAGFHFLSRLVQKTGLFGKELMHSSCGTFIRSIIIIMVYI